MKYVSWILNNIAYRVFYNAQYESCLSTEFKANIKKAIIGLYDRDNRLQIFPENFWVVEKDIFTRLNKLKNDELTTQISHSLLVNVPHTIPFTLRAKVFQHLIAM